MKILVNKMRYFVPLGQNYQQLSAHLAATIFNKVIIKWFCLKYICFNNKTLELKETLEFSQPHEGKYVSLHVPTFID